METIVYEVELTDGRTFRVFCANAAQKKKFVDSYKKVEHLYKSSRVITTGVHTQKQWEKIVETLK